MGILFYTGFDHYTSLLPRWTAQQSIAPGIGAVGRNSTNGLELNNAVSLGSSRWVRKTLPSNPSTIYQAFAFKISALPTVGAAPIFVLLDNGTEQISLYIRADGKLQFYRGLGTAAIGPISSKILTAGVFYHIEFKAVIDPSAGSVDLRINEVGDPNFPGTGLNTRATSHSFITQIAPICSNSAGGSTFTHYYDDIVTRDDDWSGDVQCKSRLPTGTGSTDQWAANGAASTREAVDESAPNDDTDYASTSTVGDKSLWTYDPIPTTSDVKALQTLPYVKKTDAGSAGIKPAFKIGANSYVGTEQAPSDGSYAYFHEIFETSPDTGVAWTPSEVNAIEAGIERSS